MPLEYNNQDGADALGQNQYTDALGGTYWSTGWEATPGTGSLEVDIATGTGSVDGTSVETTSVQTIDFTGDVDPDDPRKAVIYVGSGATVTKSLGTPEAARPTNQIREQTYTPSPPDSVIGVVVAEVWLGAGATEVVSADIRDRRVANTTANDLDGFSFTAAGYSFQNKSIGTVYQNTTGNPLEVSISIEAGPDQFIWADLNVDDSTTPSAGVSTGKTTAGSDGAELMIRAIVPHGYYYELESLGGTSPSIGFWTEQELRLE